jgi:predicted AlkP superfamily phosphohydrolase/phosphomutase/tetratricopeptide (TPR) repeat protein
MRLANRVLLIGWDAADWKHINPLLDRGLMPNLDRLINNGVMGNIGTLQPVLSPMLWNSIATGKTADKHGILDFSELDPHTGRARPVSSTSRKVKAIWNILMQSGFNANVIGWFAGHPAEPLNGISISPLYPNPSGLDPSVWPLAQNSVHPPDLADTLAPLRIHPSEMTVEEILHFIPRAAEIDQTKDRKLAVLASQLAECCSLHNAATWVMENRPWDFLAVYFNAIDHFCHTFMPFYAPRMNKVEQKDFEIYQGAVNGAYRFHDLLLGRMMELAGPDTTIVLVSDHGFHSDHLRPRGIANEPAGPTIWHRNFGIICMAGPHIRKDERIYGATLLDVTPTILTMFGLPVGKDMDGKVLLPAFSHSANVQTIESWETEPGECGMHASDLRMDPEAARIMLEQFVALGYMEPPSENQAKAAASVAREADYNLARVYLSLHKAALAFPLFRKLVDQNPGQTRFVRYLAQSHIDLRQFAEAKEALSAHAADSPRPWIEFLRGVIALEEQELDLALQHLRLAEEHENGSPQLHVCLGNVYLLKNFVPEAEAAFERALELDPDHPYAHVGLARTRLKQRNFQKSAEHALTAVGLQHLLPLGHFILGISLARLRDYSRAILALETALSLHGSFVPAHRYLVAIHGRPGGDPGRAASHRLRIAQIRRERGNGPKA